MNLVELLNYKKASDKRWLSNVNVCVSKCFAARKISYLFLGFQAISCTFIKWPEYLASTNK